MTDAFDDSQSVLAEALRLKSEGFSVLPCEPGIRYPTINWGRYQKEIASDEQIYEWFSNTSNNIAIATGPISNVTVVDVDGVEGYESLMKAGISLPRTRVIKTPHGWHLWYRYISDPDVISYSGVYPHVDVKSGGGCVCVPPSKVADGEYRVFRDYPIAEFTLNPSSLYPISRRRGAGAGEKTKAWLTETLTTGAAKGTRNQTTAKLAGYLHSKGVAMDIAISLLQAWDEARNMPALGSKEVDDVVHSVYRYKGLLSLDATYQGEI